MTNYTPGPWRIGDAGKTVFWPVTDEPSPIAITNLIPPTPRAGIDERKANARLIAAAPELLEALESIVAAYSNIGSGAIDSAAVIALARAAIAKATK